MEPMEALIRAIEDEAEHLGLNTSEIDMRLGEVLERIVFRFKSLTAPGPVIAPKNGTDRSYEQRLRDSGHLA
jgi:ParB-like chromosome segregation protein Spo0J